MSIASQEIGILDFDTRSDVELVESVLGGNRDDYGVLTERHRPKLFRVLCRYTHNSETAADIVQDTFVRVWEKLHQYNRNKSFSTWLISIGVNLAIDERRRVTNGRRNSGRDVSLADFDINNGDRSFDPESPRDESRQIENNEAVHVILKEIPEKYRKVLVWKDMEGYSASEIASMVGRDEVTVRWRLSQARKRFRRSWLRKFNNSDEQTIAL